MLQCFSGVVIETSLQFIDKLLSISKGWDCGRLLTLHHILSTVITFNIFLEKSVSVVMELNFTIFFR